MELVEVGYVARAHGIRGELRVVCHNPDSDVFEHVPRVSISGTSYEVHGARPVGSAVLLRLAGLTDRNTAESLRGRTVEVERELLPVDEKDVLLVDLVGLAVELSCGKRWGEVVSVELGPQDRLVIHDAGIERLLPVVDEFIREIDIEGGRLVVDPPDGWPESPVRRRG